MACSSASGSQRPRSITPARCLHAPDLLQRIACEQDHIGAFPGFDCPEFPLPPEHHRCVARARFQRLVGAETGLDQHAQFLVDGEARDVIGLRGIGPEQDPRPGRVQRSDHLAVQRGNPSGIIRSGVGMGVGRHFVEEGRDHAHER